MLQQYAGTFHLSVQADIQNSAEIKVLILFSKSYLLLMGPKQTQIIKILTSQISPSSLALSQLLTAHLKPLTRCIYLTEWITKFVSVHRKKLIDDSFYSSRSTRAQSAFYQLTAKWQRWLSRGGALAVAYIRMQREREVQDREQPTVCLKSAWPLNGQSQNSENTLLSTTLQL